MRPEIRTIPGDAHHLFGAKPCRSASPAVRAIFAAIEGYGYSQQSVAKAAGLSHVTLTNWKLGRGSPDIMNLSAVAEVLGLEIIVRPVANKSTCDALSPLTTV